MKERQEHRYLTLNNVLFININIALTYKAQFSASPVCPMTLSGMNVTTEKSWDTYLIRNNWKYKNQTPSNPTTTLISNYSGDHQYSRTALYEARKALLTKLLTSKCPIDMNSDTHYLSFIELHRRGGACGRQGRFSWAPKHSPSYCKHSIIRIITPEC